MLIDLRTVSYSSWIELIFDHPALYSLEDEKHLEAWYWQDRPDLLTVPETQVRYLSRLCRDPSPLLRSYTSQQIDQGLWYIFSPAGGEDFCDHIFDPEVPWPARAELIAALPSLWPGLFERQQVGTMSYMLWDGLAYGFQVGTRRPEGDADLGRVQEAMLEALTGQLDSPAAITQYAALHGLGHLSHPDCGDRIRAFLEKRAMEPEVREYAEQVLAGDFL